MQLQKSCCFLVCAGEGAQLRILIVAAQKRNTHRRSGAADLVVVAGIDLWRRRRIVSAQAVGQDQRGMAGEVGDDELLAAGGSNDDIDLLKGIRALLYSDGLTIRGVQKVLKERGHRHVADLGRGEMHVPEPQEPQVPQVQVVEKIVYVERPAVVAAPEPAPKAKKSRTHLRAVPDTLSLPFFDQPVPSREFPVLDAAPALVVETVTDFDVTDEPVVEIAPEGPVDDGLTDDALANEGLANEGLAAADRERLEELLDELSGLKTRLQAAREAIQN